MERIIHVKATTPVLIRVIVGAGENKMLVVSNPWDE